MNPVTMTTATSETQQAIVPIKSPSPESARPPVALGSVTANVGGGSGGSSTGGGGGGVSGFVLKLFSMINGAEDEVVSVSFTDCS